jgi:outer membrane immunogenic protein
MKKLLFAGVAFATLIGTAHAADMYVKAPVYAPAFTWSGCYVGGNIGGAWSHSNFTTSLEPGTHLGLAANVAAVGAAGTGSATDGGIIGGGQAGCNWQVGAWVWGIEGDFDGLSADPTFNGGGVLTTGNGFAITNAMKADWLATVRPRLGYAFNRSLIYVTGGAAFMHLSYAQTYSDTLFAGVGSSSASSTQAGWTVGGGWEYAWTNNWSTKVEYLYAHFSSISSVGGIVSTTGGTNVLQGSGDFSTQVVRAGLNYKF